MALPSYILLTPIGKHKGYSLAEFFENITRFHPSPKEVAFCVGSKVLVNRFLPILKKSNIPFTLLLFRKEEKVKKTGGILHCIMESREILRKHFLKSGYEWALWLDSDIIPDPDCFLKLYLVAEKHKALVVNSGCPGRDGRIWHGAGLMLTHRIACQLSRFMVSSISTKEGLKNFSEDFMFLSLIEAPGVIYFTKLWTGRSGRVVGDFVSVKHVLAPGKERYLGKRKLKLRSF